MIFSSVVFAQFFLVYLIAHFLVPTRLRMFLIVIGSTYFYGYWNPYYVWLPFFLTFVAWFGVKLIDPQSDTKNRRLFLTLTIILLLVPLAVYKYANFIYNDVIGLVIDAEGLITTAALPLGISFITFTLISYVVDVYKNKFPVERNFLDLSGYVLFFPQLIAGPILRPRQLLPQLHAQSHQELSYRDQLKYWMNARFVLGLFIFTVGVVKKVIFADTIGVPVDEVFSSAGNSMDAWSNLFAWYAFTIQIYCDFSGYTDMAIGLGLMLRVRLPTNFKRPFTARSIDEFWRLWHITLSNWLRDYLYISVGGNRHGLPKQVRNVLITMGLGGLWHGASWNFVLWGILHGLAIGLAHTARKFNLKTFTLPTSVKIFLTFHFVVLTFVLFRAPDFPTALRVFSAPFTAGYGDFLAFLSSNGFYLGLMLVFLFTHRFDKHSIYRLFVRKCPAWICVGIIVWLLILAMVLSHGSSAKFIYFDF